MIKTRHVFNVREDFIVFGCPVIQDDDICEVADTLKSGWIGPGPKAEQFETIFREYTGAKYAVALESGTASLFLSMLVAGIGPGDEVITTPMTFCATANAIIHTGAMPVFADIEMDTWTIDPEKTEAAISPRTKAIIPVHIYGRPCKMDQILEIARRHNLVVIEDAAHCIEGWYRGKKVGNIGDMSCFSFYANKNVTTAKGGMVTTNREDWAQKLRLYRNNGLSNSGWDRFSKNKDAHYEVAVPGFNYSMTDIQAGLGINQLKRVGQQLVRREEIWEKYDEAFADLPITLQKPPGKDMVHARHLYAVLTENGISRDELRKQLHELKVGTGIHYVSLHLHEYYRGRFGFKHEDYPIAKYVSERTFSLPLCSSLSEQDVDYVIRAVSNTFNYFS